MRLDTPRAKQQPASIFTAAATAVFVLAVAAILYLGREIFVPIALAGLLSFVLAPGVALLQRSGLPKGIAIVTTVALAFAIMGALAVVVGGQVARLGADVPRYQNTIRTKISALGDLAAPSGVTSRAIDSIGELGRELRRLGSPSVEADTKAGAPPMRVIVEDGSGWIRTVGGYLSPLLHPLATAGIVLVFAMFLLGARDDLRNRLIRFAGTEDIQQTTAVIDDGARRLSQLFLMQLIVNTALGATVAAGLWIIGLPSPLLWGVLAGLSRFVPYVGAVVGILPPLAIAFAVDPGWSMLIWTILLFAVVEPALGQVIEPLLFGRSTGLSPVAVILSATVWAFLWGPIGLILATPLTVCLVVLGRHVKALSFIDTLLGDRPALSPPQIFYQRMLAGDPTEAILQAREFLRERALSTYYDEVALEALRLAHQDIARGRLSIERQAQFRRSTGILIARLDTLISDPRPKGGQMGAEAAAAVSAAGPDQKSATVVFDRETLPTAWRGAAAAVCLARSDTLDVMVANMLAQVLRKHGIPAVTVPTEKPAATETQGDTRVAYLSYLEPLSTLHLRYAVRVARRRFEGASVVLGIWRERDAIMGRALGKAARSDAVTPTIGAALTACIALVKAQSEPAT